MTDLSQTDLKPISVKKVIITLLATAVIGSVIGLAAWSLMLANGQAFAIVSIGKTLSSSSTLLIEEPQALIERIKSPRFAAAAAARAGIQELSMLLPAAQYGASGALSARSLRDPNMVEIRVNLPQPDLALKAVTAVVDELIADHEAELAPLLQNLQSTLAVLNRHATEMIESNAAISKRIVGSTQNGEVSQDSMALLSARALTEAGLVPLVKSESELRMLAYNIRKTQVIVAPTVTTMKASSLYRIVAAGTLFGLLVGLLLLQMFPGFFRTYRPA